MPAMPAKFRILAVPALVAVLALGAAACDDSDEKVFKSPGNTESKPAATLLEQLKNSGGNGLSGQAEAPTPVASVTYLMNIETAAGVGVCNGDFSGQILSNFSFKLPQAEIQCLGLTVDIAALLNGGGAGGLGGGAAPAASGSGAANPLAAIEHDGYVLKLKSFLGASFEPARPVLLGPIVQNPEKYKGYDKVFETTLSGDAGGEHIQKAGKFHVVVLDHHASYSNAGIVGKDKLESIIHWKMTAEGFDGVPANLGGAIDSLEFKWNTRPIMIPYIQIKGKLLQGFLKGDAASLGKAVGELVITVVVKDFTLN